ncbi:hypothetical protein BLOT_015136 [Blomia tropicalis]|nr:hypothetical protein BLOT_015136 [Blomia tropicalis]
MAFTPVIGLRFNIYLKLCHFCATIQLIDKQYLPFRTTSPRISSIKINFIRIYSSHLHSAFYILQYGMAITPGKCYFVATIQLIDKQYLNQFHTHLLFTSAFYILQFGMAITPGKTTSLYYYDFTDFVPDYPEYANPLEFRTEIFRNDL